MEYNVRPVRIRFQPSKDDPFYLMEVLQSTIPSAGLGTFATVFIPKDTNLGKYYGDILTTKPKCTDYTWLVTDTDKFGNGVKKWVDGLNYKEKNPLRYVNSPDNNMSFGGGQWLSCVNTSMFISEGDVHYQTTRNINKGEELFIDYGIAYWVSRNHQVHSGKVSRLLSRKFPFPRAYAKIPYPPWYAKRPPPPLSAPVKTMPSDYTPIILFSNEDKQNCKNALGNAIYNHLSSKAFNANRFQSHHIPESPINKVERKKWDDAIAMKNDYYEMVDEFDELDEESYVHKSIYMAYAFAYGNEWNDAEENYKKYIGKYQELTTTQGNDKKNDGKPFVSQNNASSLEVDYRYDDSDTIPDRSIEDNNKPPELDNNGNCCFINSTLQNIRAGLKNCTNEAGKIELEEKLQVHDFGRDFCHIVFNGGTVPKFTKYIQCKCVGKNKFGNAANAYDVIFEKLIQFCPGAKNIIESFFQFRQIS